MKDRFLGETLPAHGAFIVYPCMPQGMQQTLSTLDLELIDLRKKWYRRSRHKACNRQISRLILQISWLIIFTESWSLRISWLTLSLSRLIVTISWLTLSISRRTCAHQHIRFWVGFLFRVRFELRFVSFFFYLTCKLCSFPRYIRTLLLSL